MRTWFISSLLVLGATCLQAQEQERRLVDRILEPNLELQNRAQHRQFATEGAAANRKVTARTSHIPENALSKKYAVTGEFSTREFGARHFRDGDATAPVKRQAKVNKQANIDSARMAWAIHAASDNSKSVATSQFAGQRPFLGRGKSQKELSKRDTPLTIEQVRELLNKNK